MTFSSALVLFAHPDDAEFMCGGTIATWTREGCEVHYVVITDGSAGTNEPGVTREQMRPIREREQRAAAEVLGVKSVTFLGEVDGMLEVTLDTRRKVTREVRRLRPEVIVAPDPVPPVVGEPIHQPLGSQGGRDARALVRDARRADSRPMFQELEQEGIEPFEVQNLWLSSNEPDTYVDITDTIDIKIKSLEQHVSQGGAEAEPWVRLRAEQTGQEAGYTYAEAFKAFRFVDDPVEE